MYVPVFATMVDSSESGTLCQARSSLETAHVKYDRR